MTTFTAKPMEHSDNLTRRACRNTRVGERFVMVTDTSKTEWVRVRGGCAKLAAVAARIKAATVTPAGTGMKGAPVEAIIERFFGDLKQWPLEPDGHNFTQAQIRDIADHIHATGDCLWHAQSIVMQWPACHCAACEEKEWPKF